MKHRIVHNSRKQFRTSHCSYLKCNSVDDDICVGIKMFIVTNSKVDAVEQCQDQWTTGQDTCSCNS